MGGGGQYKSNQWCLSAQQCDLCDLVHVQDTLTSDSVDKDEVFKVGYLPPLPALSHVRGFEKLLWCSQRDSPDKDGKPDYFNWRYPRSL